MTVFTEYLLPLMLDDEEELLLDTVPAIEEEVEGDELCGLLDTPLYVEDDREGDDDEKLVGLLVELLTDGEEELLDRGLEVDEKGEELVLLLIGTVLTMALNSVLVYGWMRWLALHPLLLDVNLPGPSLER